MKHKHFLLASLFLFAFCGNIFGNEKSDTTGKTGKITLILQGIKTEQASKSVAESNLMAEQNNLSAQKPLLEKSRDEKLAEAKEIFVAHDGKHEEGSAEYSYWQGLINAAVAEANSYQGQIDQLQKAVDDAKKQLDDANAALEDWQNQLQAIGNVSSANWDCFFDGKCGDYGAAPEKGKGFVIVPNSGPPITSGAPGIFTPLTQEYKDRHKIDNKSIPAPQATPPQKGMIEQATEKVKSYFRDVINRMQQIKIRRVGNAVLAVRG